MLCSFYMPQRNHKNTQKSKSFVFLKMGREKGAARKIELIQLQTTIANNKKYYIKQNFPFTFKFHIYFKRI